MSHVAWSCDGKKLAAVGIDKIVRVWQPEKTVSTSYVPRSSDVHNTLLDGDSRRKYLLWCPRRRRRPCFLEPHTSGVIRLV